MFPLLAIGAVLLGAAGAVAAAETSAPSKGARKPKGPDETQAAVMPQSYLVTPVSGEQARAVTPMEGVTRFIV
jgi:hypothetical protein